MPLPHPSRRALLFSLGATAFAAAFKAFAKIGRIELGVCGNPDAFPQAEQWGFDYFEPGAASIAAGSALTELIAGQDRAGLGKLRASDVDGAVGGLSNESKHAAVLCEDAVRALLTKLPA